MKKAKCLLVVIMIAFNCCSAQSISKTFGGWWASTQWTFEFHKNNTYKRTSRGHYGNTNYEGTYKMSGDTIRMVTGSDQIVGIMNSPLLLYQDSFLIDLFLYYDYKISDTGASFYPSSKRYDILKKIDPDSLIVASRYQFDSMVRECIDVLQKHPVARIYDEDNIRIIRVSNTLAFSRDTSFKTGIYADFSKLMQQREYNKEIAIFYDWIPNKGMGFYFKQLHVELGGTPGRYSMYTIQ